MWEILRKSPRGRISLRKFSVSLATFLVAVFGYTLLASTPVLAADATWGDDPTKIEYNNLTFTKGEDSKPKGIPNGSYWFGAHKADSDSAYVIYFDPSLKDDRAVHSATSAFVITYDYTESGNSPNGYTLSNPSDPKQISIEPRAPPEDPNDPANATQNSYCELDGIGWFVCPVSTKIAEAMDYLYGIVSSFFNVSYLTTDQGTLYFMWNIFRNIANIVFVIGFLVIIYGQASGGLLSNYTIKKLLPRLILAAILVNISYWICALAVDISNILGYSVQNLFMSLRDLSGAPNTEANTGLTTWGNVAAAILGGGTLTVVGVGALVVATGTVTGLAFLLLGSLIPAIFAILIAIAVLAARQALITVFIILSPLAFVAYLLPNTEDWFNRWRKTFTTMLIMFPAFSVIFGGAQLAGTLIIQNTDSIPVVLLGMTVQIVPLFITPFLIRLSSGLMSTIANLTNDKSKGIFDRTRNWANTRREQEQARGRMQRDMYAREQGFVGGRRPGSRSRRLLSRANPYNRAIYSDYRRREREGLKAQHEAMSGALFADTDAGRNIHRLGEYAKLEKGRADNLNQASWENEVRLNPHLNRLAHQSHEAHERASLYKNAVEAEGDEHWKQRLQTDAGLRAIRTDTHTTQGRAKLIDEALTNADERTLQTQIYNQANLRGLKVQADVDSAHAQFLAANVTAEGKATFQREVFGDRALKSMNVNTVALEKEAGVIENTLKQRAEAHWERTTSNDSDPEFNQALRNLRMQEVQATDSHKKAEAQWDKLIENIRAEGKNAPGISENEDKMVAGKIQQLGQDIAVEQWATEAAKTKTKLNLAQELKKNEDLREYAGGIGGVAASNRIYAKSTKDIVDDWLTEREHSRSLLSEYTQKQLVRLHRKGIDRDGNYVGDNEAFVDAALQVLALEKGNNWALQKLRDNVVTKHGMIQEEDADGNIRYYETVKDDNGEIVYEDGRAVRGNEIADQDVISRNRDVQQLLADAIRKSGLKVASISQTDISELDSGVGVTSGKQAIIRDIITGKFDQEKMSTLDVDELQRMVQILRDESVRDSINAANPEALTRLLNNIDGAQTNPLTRGRIKDRERGVMFALASYLDPQERARFDNLEDDPEKYFYSKQLDDGSIVRARPDDETATRHEMSVKPAKEYLVDDFLNTPDYPRSENSR